MAEDYRRIAVNKVCIAEICFRKKDVLFNEGKVVLDIDTYDFAGFITDDVIVGYYRDGKYQVYYYYNCIEFREIPNSPKINTGTVLQYSYEQKVFNLEAEFYVVGIPETFTNTTIFFDRDFELTFNNIWGRTVEETSKVIEHNSSLLMGRQD